MLAFFVNSVDQIYVCSMSPTENSMEGNLNLRLSSSHMGSAEEGSFILAVVLVQVSVVAE